VCGIAGWIGQLGESHEAIDSLTRALRHRGPDSQGHGVWSTGALVHTRLSIIDLSEAGHQPIGNEDGSIWAVFNGEIYNHHDLRADLQRRGHQFRGRSDSEVLPHLYEEYGADLAGHLRGMFAFAILDSRTRTLLLVRDRFGIKPLFHATVPGGLAFASEINALRRFPGVDVTVDGQAAADYAALSYIPAPMTLFRGIRCLEPGQTLRAVDEGGKISCSPARFHRFRVVLDHGITLESATERARELVTRCVRRQLESDVPLGCMLSGGIDSSLVSAAALKWLPQGLQTYNVRMPDPRYDETWAALSVARHIGSRHKILTMDAEGGTWAGVTSLLAHCGQPFADTSVFAVDAVCREMRKEVTVALCGDGGDEGFGGYYLHWMAERVAGWLQYPRIVLRAGAPLAALAARVGAVSASFPSRFRRYLDASDAEIIQSLTAWIDRPRHRQLIRGTDFEPLERHFLQQWEHDLGSGTGRADRLSALATECNIRLALPNDFLFKTDIASMRVGLEIRVPLLDEDLMDFALSLPRQLKVRGRTGKLILRRLAAQILPAEVANKPKQGFGVPVDRWLDQVFRRSLGRVLFGPRSVLPEFYHPEVYRPWLESFIEGRQHPGLNRSELYYRAIMLLALQMTLAPESAGV